jgi:amphi-Trp domain-containing protein
MSEHETDHEGETDHEAADERTVIREGRDYEQIYRLSAAEAGEFLVALGEGLQSGGEVTITDEEWELPFAFGEPVTVELDYEGVDETELEVEVEIPGRPDETAPGVE